MGTVWVEPIQVGTFYPDVEGSAGDIFIDALDVGDFGPLLATGYVYIDALQVGVYTTSSGPPPPPPPPPTYAPEDARYRTKVYLDSYISPVWLTKDDGVTLASYAVIYANPDYSLAREFLAPLSPVDVLFCVSKPDSTAIIGQDRKAYAYEEHVPITVWTIDKTGITGTKLCWKAEAELRRIIETYPLGSLRSLTRIEDNEQNLGSTILYSVEYVLKYTRAKA